MSPIKLNCRLNKIFDAVLGMKPLKVIDVGCDHGKLAVRCAESGIETLCTDISEQSLDKAKKLFEKLGLKGTFVCTDGLKGIDHTGALVVIAGMGGEEIIRILSGDKLAERLVLCPHQSTVKLREFLVDRGYKIALDSMVLERGTYYDVIAATKLQNKQDKLTELELVFGRTNLKRDNPDFESFVIYQKQKFEKILKKLKNRDAKVNKYVIMLDNLLRGEKNV